MAAVVAAVFTDPQRARDQVLDEQGAGRRHRVGATTGPAGWGARGWEPGSSRAPGTGTATLGAASRGPPATSLGVMLFEMLAGQLPFAASTAGDLIALHITSEPPDLGTCAPTVSQQMVELIGQMLAKLPSTRPTMRAVEERLAGIEQRLLAGTAVSTRSRRQRGQRLRWSALGLAVLGLALGGVRVARLRPPVQPSRPRLAAPTSLAAAVSPPASAAPPGAPAPAVSWTIRTVPAGARIVRAADQVLVGTTPWQDRAAQGEGDLEVAVELPGFRPQRLLLSRRHDTAWDLPLQPLAAETRAAAGAARGRHATAERSRDRAQTPAATSQPAQPPGDSGAASLSPAVAATEPPAASQPPPSSPPKREQPHDDDVEVPALH